MNFNGLNILYYDSKEITLDNIIWGLLQLGADVERSKLKVTLNNPVESEIEYIKKEIVRYNCVMTQNFCVNVAIACYDQCVPYISWVYDSPQVSLYSSHSAYPTNFIFAFDKAQVKRLKECGVANIFHMPLAANMAYVSGINITKDDHYKYSSDISFIGQLYRLEYIEQYIANASNNIVEQLNMIVDKKAFDWNKGVSIYNSFTDQLCKMVSINAGDFDYFSLMDEKYIKETMLLGPLIARKEREGILNLAGAKHKTTFYTKEADVDYSRSNIDKVKTFGPVRGQDPYKIYSSSKLNLNLTLRTIETAVPQRVFDIMSMGGTVISNYQEEAEELFEPDKEIILFSCKEEFLEKAEYYLKHDGFRKKIGEAGYRKVAEKYNYTYALNKMFDVVMAIIG